MSISRLTVLLTALLALLLCVACDSAPNTDDEAGDGETVGGESLDDGLAPDGQVDEGLAPDAEVEADLAVDAALDAEVLPEDRGVEADAEPEAADAAIEEDAEPDAADAQVEEDAEPDAADAQVEEDAAPPAPICGDGVVNQDTEECDDGAHEPGDGCDPDCRVERFCGDGEVNRVGEVCDDGNNMPDDGCDPDCQLEPFCGDGETNAPGEVCDDANEDPEDGCHECQRLPICGDGEINAEGEECDDGGLSPEVCAACRVAPVEASAGGRFEGRLHPQIPFARFRVELDAPRRVRIDTAPEGCANDPVLRLRAVDDAGATLLLDLDDDEDACPQVERLLGAGVYWIEIELRSGPGDFAMGLALEACGNDLLDDGEGCDDGNLRGGDGCTPHCRLEGTCGDGEIVGVEECEDGNRAPGDGCDAFCRLEPTCGDGVAEAPEDCDDGADDVAGDGCLACVREPINVNGGGTFEGGVGGRDGIDHFVFSLAEETWIEAWADDGAGGCAGDTGLALAPIINGARLPPVAQDEDGWVGDCARLEGNLPAGDWVIDARGAARLEGGYALTLALDGEEPEPREPVDVSAGGAYPGSHAGEVFALELQAPARVTLWTHEAEGGCETIDTRMVLREPGRAPLAEDDDSGEGRCSRVVRELDAGRYEIEVTEGPGGAAAYLLSVQIQPRVGLGEACEQAVCAVGHCEAGVCAQGLCGDGALDADEECDREAAPPGAQACEACLLSPLDVSEGGVFPIRIEAGETRFRFRFRPVESTAVRIQVRGCVGSTELDVGGPIQDLDPGPCALFKGELPSALVDGHVAVEPSAEATELELLVDFRPATDCGNEVVEQGEGCDDGNGRAGDGCANCQLEPVCGDGVAEGDEACDDGGREPNDGCDAQCRVEPPSCGDGRREGEEECDDGAREPNDGCDADCVVEAVDISEGGTFVGGFGAGSLDRYTLTSAVSRAIRVTTSEGPEGCPADLDMALSLDVGGNLVPVGELFDGLDGGPCAGFEVNLVPGTYVGIVRNPDGLPVQSYTLSVTLIADCGDGLIEGDEECDGGPGCTPNCALICGNGTLDEGEACDDGNSNDGDGCSAACQDEHIDVSEGGRFARPGFGPGAADFFTFELEQPLHVILETTGLDGCAGDTAIVLNDASSGVGVQVALDDDGGEGVCSRIARDLLPGVRYDVQVIGGFGAAALGPYFFDVTLQGECGNDLIEPGETCDDGNQEAEDGCDADCQIEIPPERPDVSAGGDFRRLAVEQGEGDFFPFSLPRPATLTAFLSDGDGGCASPGAIISLIRRVEGNIEPLGLSDQVNEAGCAHFVIPVAAGDFEVVVVGGQNLEAVPAYTLHVAFAGTCGNGVHEIDEQCDGQGCGADCLASAALLLPPQDTRMNSLGAQRARRYRFTLAGPSQVELYTHDGEGGCDPGLDTNLFLDALDGYNQPNRIAGVDDDPANPPCTRISGLLPAGTYDVLLQGQGGLELPHYALTLEATGTCGDGIRTADEQCDDGDNQDFDGCDADCDFEHTCGDGQVEPGEECDPPGGDCDQQCQGVRTDITGFGIQDYAASIGAGGRRYFRLSIDEPLDLITTTGDGAGGCPFDTVMTISRVAGPSLQLLATSDDEAGISPCSLLRGTLAPDTYEIMVRGFDGAFGDFVLHRQLSRCGNGRKEAPEACDDGNLDPGDGCDAECQPEGLDVSAGGDFADEVEADALRLYVITVEERRYVRLAVSDGLGGCGGDSQLRVLSEGEVLVSAEGGDNAPCPSTELDLYPGQHEIELLAHEAHAFVLTVGFPESVCGDQQIEARESCEGDESCSAACLAELQDGSQPSGQTGRSQFIVYDLTLASRRGVFLDTAGDAGCSQDSALWVRDASGELVGEVDGEGGCAAVGLDLAAGAYELTLLSRGEEVDYSLDVQFNTCGDTIRELGEDCDPGEDVPGDFCDAACQSIAGCGNDVIDEGETCDDGNDQAGDWCDGSCQIEVLDAGEGGAFALHVGPGATARYSLSLQAERTLRSFTGDGVGGCGADTILEVIDTQQPARVLAFDDDRGEGTCSEVLLVLPPGEYQVQAYEKGRDAAADFTLTIGLREAECGNRLLEGAERCDDGADAAGDGCDAACQPEGTEVSAGGDFASGGFGAGQVEFFWLQIDQPTQLSLQTGNGVPGQCGIADTQLTLFDALGEQIAFNDDIDLAGQNYCSRIAQAVEPGLYLARVNGFNGGAVGAYTFSVGL